jgi:hypothetical protein
MCRITGSVDQGIRVRDPNAEGGFYFAYGGDFGDIINDAQFCCNVRSSSSSFPNYMNGN